ncbi:MAG: hypothetical protein JMDDDDMK_01658 [Acidobacteria bacterium]|nr:hypothetical protein [Acidobacteriota bacterium]
MFQSLRHDGQRQFNAVRFGVGFGRREQRHIAKLRSRDAPVNALLALLRDRHCLLRSVEQVRARHLQLDLRDFVGVKIVVNDAGNSDDIAFGHKARSFQTQDQILARKHAADVRPDAQVVGHSARRRSPRRQVVGQIEFHRRLAVGAGHHVRLPECGVFEFLANLRLDELAVVFEIGQLIRTFVRGQFHLLAAGIAGEKVGGREMRLDSVVSRAVKRAADVA